LATICYAQTLGQRNSGKIDFIVANGIQLEKKNLIKAYLSLSKKKKKLEK
jgi:hypothetical protein